MELKGSSAFPSVKRESPFENPFGEVFPDPLCKLNLKETSEFVKAFPMTSKNISVVQRRSEAPPTPGRPVFRFSAGNLSMKSVPSKWDDAEKWLISSSCHESPAHVEKHSDTSKISGRNDVLRVTEEKLTSFQGPVATLDPSIAFPVVASEVLLKDKFTDNAEPVCPNFQFSNPTKEGFLYKDSYHEPLKDGTPEIATEVQHRDIGTEMTPLGSSTTSRCHTPIKSSSPARHNTPANRSGPLVTSNTSFDISQLMDCHFAKLELNEQYDSMVSNWSSREEEEAEVSKSLRQFEMNGGRKSITESRDAGVFLWEDEERTKSCLRYQREEAKIQAWVNLQSAKAEAQSRKLEVKIQKMRSNLEEKLMKRMAIVHRRAEELRAAAQLQHSQQILRASEQAQKMKSHHMHTSCGCFPCNNHL